MATQAKRTRKVKDVFDPFMGTWEWAKTRALRERTQKREDDFKKRLMTYLEEEGEIDANGHKYYFFDEPLTDTGLLTAPSIAGIKRQRNVSQTMDEERTLKFLGEKGLLHRCTSTVTVINEEAILAANFDGTITDKELEALYDEKETFSFIPIKDKKDKR